jgi:hypothetical protein
LFDRFDSATARRNVAPWHDLWVLLMRILILFAILASFAALSGCHASVGTNDGHGAAVGVG